MNHDKSKLTAKLDAERENVRTALANYAAALGAAIILTDDQEDERRQHAASLTQVASAQRVLWMD